MADRAVTGEDAEGIVPDWLHSPGRNGSVADRFWRRVTIAGDDDCWPWKGSTSGRGYGTMHTRRASTTAAHRVSIWLDGRAIPEGYVVDHMCRNRICVNPRHLRVVTQRINAIENSEGPTAKNAAKTHCSNGHPLSGDNVKDWYGTRRCITCQRKFDLESYYRRKEARALAHLERQSHVG